MTPPAGTLRCDKCGALNVGDLELVAKPGGLHYRKHVRPDEPRKTEGRFVRMTTCGNWRAVT